MRYCYTSDTLYDQFATSAGTSIAQQMATFPGMTDQTVTGLLKQEYLKAAVRNLMRAHIEEPLVEYYRANNLPSPPTNYMHIEDARNYVDVMLHNEFNARHLYCGEEVYAALCKAIEEQVKPFVVKDLAAQKDNLAQKNPQYFRMKFNERT